MTPQKSPDHSAAAPPKGARKPWRKKPALTPVEGFLALSEGLRAEISARELELKALRDQLQKFDQARKIFEAS